MNANTRRFLAIFAAVIVGDFVTTIIVYMATRA